MAFRIYQFYSKRRLKRCLMFMSIAIVWILLQMIMSTKSLHNVTSLVAPFYTTSKNASRISLADVAPLDSSLQQDEIQSAVLKKRTVFHSMAECFETTVDLENADKPVQLWKNSTQHKFECNHFMTLGFDYYGRTGNQMFQVAALLGTASYHGYTAIIDRSLSIHVTALFDLPNVSRVKFENVSHFEQRDCCRFNENVKQLNHEANWTLHGFFQSWKYFDGYENVVKSAFKVKDDYARAAQRWINATVSTYNVKVCIHVRRGDFVKYERNGFSVAPIRYIKRAARHFLKKYEHVHFFVVSDDKSWCKKNIRWKHVSISPFITIGHDMALMMECDHVIVTSGSFGWWGAWLAGGDTVYWTGYPGKRTTWLGKQFNYTDYYPSHWTGLS